MSLNAWGISGSRWKAGGNSQGKPEVSSTFLIERAGHGCRRQKRFYVKARKRLSLNSFPSPEMDWFCWR